MSASTNWLAFSGWRAISFSTCSTSPLIPSGIPSTTPSASTVIFLLDASNSSAVFLKINWKMEIKTSKRQYFGCFEGYRFTLQISWLWRCLLWACVWIDLAAVIRNSCKSSCSLMSQNEMSLHAKIKMSKCNLYKKTSTLTVFVSYHRVTSITW